MRTVIPLVAAIWMLMCSGGAFAYQDELQQSDNDLRRKVLRSIRDGTLFLRSRQSQEGSWATGRQYEVGKTAIAVLALIHSDEPVDSPVIQRGLAFLRNLSPRKPAMVYEASLVVMALCAADDMRRDRDQIVRLTRLLERTQCTEGTNSGLWGYELATRGGTPGANREDRSNGQFAVLALRDAAYAGIRVDQDVWRRVHNHWVTSQSSDGGWSYSMRSANQSSGSMTVAGLSTLAITTRMLEDDTDVDAGGRPDCCAPHPPPDAVEKGRRWMARNFSVYTNPPRGGPLYYYLYGLERAGRLSNVRFFGEHDWYRQGARYFVEAQRGDGSWREGGDAQDTLYTSFALLFLSKGLSRIVVNKLDYESVGNEESVTGEWNRHPLDVPNLIERIDGIRKGEGGRKWPPRLTSQVVAMNRLTEENAVADLNQAPVLLISGRDAPELTDIHIRWLREYIDSGGFIFAIANCRGGTFDSGIHEIVKRMFPDGDAFMQRLQPDHPVFRSEYQLNAQTVELHGVDFGCRTSLIYSPEDLGCLWQKWMKHDPPKRNEGLIQRIIRANRVGINVLAYATGREPPVKLTDHDLDEKAEGVINRGLMEIAQLRHTGGWDTAPRALPNLLQALNKMGGMAVSGERRSIPVTLEELRRFPLVYMHGRFQFQFSPQELDAIRDYLSKGAVLMADSCCGSPGFDKSFRAMIEELFPDHPLQAIPPNHELYSVGHKIRTVRLRKSVPGQRNQSLESRTTEGPPVLEGVEIDGRYAVIYSKYDISCALENQASLGCEGYEEEDAMKLAVNMVLYAMLQDIRWSKRLK